MEVSVVVPAHNEEGNLRRLVEQVTATLEAAAFAHGLELVLVDDNSTDATGEVCDALAAEYDCITVVHRTSNGGFGNAIKAGLAAASGDVLVPFMGDLSDDPADIPELVAAIEDGYDVAYGSRFVSGGSVDGYPPLKLLYNRAFNNLIRLAFGIRARDVTNAFTAYRREVVEEIGVENLDSESFDLTAELPLRAHILGFSSTEVPVSWRSRDAGISKLNATRKGPLYLTRLLDMFVRGNLAGVRDVFSVVTSGSRLRILGAALVGVLIMIALFSFSGFDEVWGIVRRANVGWLGVAAGAYLSSFVFRTWRYRVLLRTSGHLASRGGVFRCILAGWFVNFLVPARAGDAVRGFALKATEDVPFGVATGLVVVERVLDMLVLGTIMLLVATTVLETSRANTLAVGALAIALVMVLGLVVVYYLDEHVAVLLESRIPKIREATRTLNEALERVVANPYAMALAALLSLPVWALEISTIYFSGLAVGVPLGAVATTTAAVAAFVTQAVPVTPAGIGTYEATVTVMLSLFAVPASTGTALALVDHFARVATVYVLGAISVVHVGFRSREYFRERTREAARAAPASDEQ
jgi:hypothetical protein